MEAGGRMSPTARFSEAMGVGRMQRESQHLPQEELQQLECATFEDHRWDNAIQWLAQRGPLTQELAMDIIVQGARYFGMWQLHENEVKGLVYQLLVAVTAKLPDDVQLDGLVTSPALEAWIKVFELTAAPPEVAPRRTRSTGVSSLASSPRVSLKRWVKPLLQLNTMERTFLLLVVLFSNLWAMKLLLPDGQAAMEIFGWPIYIARACGMATAILTGLLYLSMARGMLTFLSNIASPVGVWSRMMDAHKDLHIFFGRMMGWFGAAHVLAHCFSTVVAILRRYESNEGLADVNKVLGCANPEKKGFWFWGWPHLFWPKCPITERYGSVTELLFTTSVGLSGVALTVLLVVIAYSAAQQQRNKHFERFWWLHNIGLLLWPLIMYVHGANAWIGVGIPLTVFTTSGPLLAYVRDRLARWARCVLSRSIPLQIRSAVVRPGKAGDDVQGALVHLAVERPWPFWRSKAGRYAFICMPEYSQFQWHPFTICSSQHDRHVEFIIAAVGDWTRELTRRILESAQVDGKLPRLLLDGPYVAPAQSALQHEFLIAVGAGVGITPFLSLVSAIIHNFLHLVGKGQNHDNLPLKQMHLFWMTRSADEFLFAKPLFTQISSHPELQKRIILHLHVTAQEPTRNVQAFLFREALRRQSQLDRSRFCAVTGDVLKKQNFDTIPSALQCPACWVNRKYQDVLWVSSLFNVSDVVRMKSRTHSKWRSSVSSLRDTNDVEKAREQAEEEQEKETWNDEEFGGDQSDWRRCTSPMAFFGDGEEKEEEQRPPEMEEEPPPLQRNNALSFFRRVLTKTMCKAGSASEQTLPMAEMKNLPLVFGRPDFAKEIRAIGKANPDHNVHIYVCGNDSVVQNLNDVAEQCNIKSERNAGHGQPHQHFDVHFERFD